jgi:hypothetical protein
MKSWMTFVAALMLSGLFAACSSVSSNFPVGDPIDDEQLAGYDGIWHSGDGVLYVKGIDNGRAKAAWVEWEGDRFNLTQIDLIVASVGEQHYLNMIEPSEEEFASSTDLTKPAEPADGKKPAYFFFRMVVGGDGGVVLYPPRSEAFKTAVSDGVLEGTIESNTHSSDVHITAAKEAIEAFLTAEKIGSQFDMESPLILMRIHDLK